MRHFFPTLLLLGISFSTLAQTGGVRIGTAGTPDAKAALDVSATDKGVLVPRLTQAQRTAIAAPVPAGLLVYQTDGTTGFWYYEATAGWTSLSAGSSTGDNLGNHSATQTLNLNAQRLLGTATNSLGDSTAQVELNANVGTQSAALITRSNFTARYSRVILSGYGKLPDGTSTANDFGIWATAYRGGGWAGFFSAGSTTTPLRWVGICQNPGYNNTGSAIRIVDGTQGAGKVLTSNAQGYGTWQTPTVTAAGGNFNLGPYYLVGNGGSTGLTITSAGWVGINTTAAAGLHVTVGTGGIGANGGAGALLNGLAGSPPNLELRGSGTGSSTTPYVDFAEGNDVDFTTRLISQSGTLTVNYGGAATQPTYLFKVNGGLQCTTLNQTSDQRFKTNVHPIGSALASVLALRGVRYEWNALGVRHGGTAGAKQVGLLAQEVEKIYPELVSTDAEGYKAVNYAQLTPVLIEAIKELAARNQALEDQHRQDQVQVASFEQRLRALETNNGQAHR
ncbi:tail fiber domain-containing protein [Hymenobacter guriensis]|uniref:Tail fiber domain-containing protein n=1 Tax=Hymenobacter guriensis TaxID=2793065 RepID=A0ABS0L925_9BACT|nr:tail fiber domain-containing protein [Hymenobacter guriensis]MBG8555932.1 tail fiber domain-containing protein [Hymenobacter guriensis]